MAELSTTRPKNRGGCIALGCIGFIIIVALLDIPCFMSMQDRAKESMIKHNMQALESAVQEYAAMHRGHYPASIDSIVASRHDLTNPLAKTTPVAVTCDTTHLRISLRHGQIAYTPLLISAKGPRSYVFFAKGRDDNLLEFRIWGDTLRNAK